MPDTQRYSMQVIPAPRTYSDIASPVISDETMTARLQKVLRAMK